MPAVRIDSLSKRFGPTIALDSVSLDIPAGEICFLLGPSGCGKTTLLRSVAGFVTPDSGHIWLGGRNITQVPPHQRHTAMMFQSYALWPHLTVERNIAFGLEEQKEQKLPTSEIQKRVTGILAVMRLAHYATRRIHELSGGQQQRVALARALVVQPQCLLLDEPLSNLDTRLRIEMRAEIRRLCKDFGLTAIYVSHDQKEALAIGDRLVVMDAGRILQSGNPLDVYRHPQTRFVAEFMGETNLIQATGEGTTILTTGLGPLHTSTPTTGPILASIRPEALHLSSTPATINSIPVKIIETTYLGEIARHRLATQSPQELIALELNPKPRHSAQLYAQVLPEDVALLNP